MDRYQVGKAWEKLVDRLTRAEEEYQRLSRMEGRGALKLAAEIESLKRRIDLAESLMEK